MGSYNADRWRWRRDRLARPLGLRLGALDTQVSGNSLIVTPVTVGVGCKALTASLRELRPRYGKMLKKLAE